MTTWLTLLFPAVAIDGPEAGLSAAVRALRGNFWRAFAVLLMVMVPPLLMVLALKIAVGDPSLVTDEASNSGSPASPDGLVWGLFGAFGGVITAAATSHFYLMLKTGLSEAKD